MITLKVRYDKTVSLNSRVHDIENISMAFSRVLDEGYINVTKKCVPPIQIYTPRNVDQRITFYDSGRKMKEFVLPANSGVKTLITMGEQVKMFNEYAKTINAIDNLK